MDREDCLACSEYNRISRRGFLQLSGAVLAALGAPEWLPRVVMAKGGEQDSTRDVIVSIFLRGGADGLTLCVPYGDPAYATLRNATRILPPDGTASTAQALSNSVFFGLPPALAPLKVPYEDGKLAICHATGWRITNPSRSHFDAQRFMELGKFNDPSVFTGWLGRHLAQTGAVVPTDPVRAIGVANGLEATLQGSPKAIPVPGLAQSNSPNFRLLGATSTNTARMGRIGNMYSGTADPLKTAAQITQQTVTLLNSIPFSTYQPAGGAIYNYGANGTTTPFAYAMKSTAALLKNNMGVEAVAIDRSGWDLHSAQGVNPGGAMYSSMDDLAKGLLAFYEDVIVSSNRSVVVVVMSEFGRRAAENLSAGTDHGFGNAMFVMGTRIRGRQVLAYDAAGNPGWPGLGPGQLFQNLDLNVTLDYRDILAEICQNLLNDTNLAAVFPGYTPMFRGITA